MGSFAKIMLVDDNQDLLSLYSEVLKQDGFEVAVAANGYEALEVIPFFRPDLVISDLKMPRMNGWEFIRRLKASEFCMDLPIIVSSVEPDLRRICRDLGVSAYCDKVTSYAIISRLVREVLKTAPPVYYAQLTAAYEGKR